MLGTGIVRHRRMQPAAHAGFAYRVHFLMLPMRALRARPSPPLNRNGFGLVAFADRDHGDGGTDSLAWAEALLAEHGVHDADGEIWLQCFPRVLGHSFKPVSFWFAHRRDGELAAVIAEVNNTFGERHVYLLRGAAMTWGQDFWADKHFHVSPFFPITGGYRFRFLRTDAGPGRPPRFVARIVHEDDAGPLLVTSVSGTLEPLTARRARVAFWSTPLMTLAVVARIHWQAWRLWRGGARFHAKPAPPNQPVSRGGPATPPTTPPATSAHPGASHAPAAPRLAGH